MHYYSFKHHWWYLQCSSEKLKSMYNKQSLKCFFLFFKDTSQKLAICISSCLWFSISGNFGDHLCTFFSPFNGFFQIDIARKWVYVLYVQSLHYYEHVNLSLLLSLKMVTWWFKCDVEVCLTKWEMF